MFRYVHFVHVLLPDVCSNVDLFEPEIGFVRGYVCTYPLLFINALKCIDGKIN